MHEYRSNIVIKYLIYCALLPISSKFFEGTLQMKVSYGLL